MSFVRHALLIARRDIVLIIWRREGLAWIFVMPIVFFYFVGTATGGLGTLAGNTASEPDPLALRAPDGAGLLVDELIARLEQQNFRVDRLEADDVMSPYARRLVVAPAPETADPGTPAPETAAPEDGSLTTWALAGNTIRLRYDSDLEEPVAAFDRLRITRAAYAVFADAVAIASTSRAIDADAFADLASMPRAIGLDVRPAGLRELPPVGFAQAVPGTMVMFVMLIALTGGAIHLVIERNQGLLRRLASAPVSRSSIIVGKLGGRVAVAAIQIAFAMLAGSLLFRVDWGPSLPMVVAVLVGWAMFSAAAAVLLANLVRSDSQAMGIGILSSMVLAALGGAWWPIEVAPEWMQRLAMFLPTGWAMDAIHKLVNFAYEPAAAVPHLLGIVAASLVLAWAGARTFRYS